MAQKHLFGRALSIRFIPQADDEDVSAYALNSSGARIYADYPTEEQIEDVGQASTGHIGSRVTSWTATGENEYTVAFPALTDSNPHADTDYETYYVVFNYKAESGGADIFDVETIFVYRPDSHTSKIEVTAADVFKLESRIKEVAPTVLWVEECIQSAIDDILAELESRGYQKRRLFNFQKMNLAAQRLGTAYCCDKLAQQNNQFWAAKADKWEKRGWKMFEAAMIGYDITGNDRPTSPEETKFSGAVSVAR